MINAFSPFNNAPPNEEEQRYLKILADHHQNFIDFSLTVFRDHNVETVVEIGSYLSNVAYILRKHVKSFLATDVNINKSRDLYEKWAEENDIQTSYNLISQSGLVIEQSDHKFDALLASEIMEHLPFNPLNIVQSFKQYLTSDGVVVLSVPYRASFAKILRFLRGRHPFIFFHEFASANYVTANFGHHWLEYNLRDMDFVFNYCGYERIAFKKANINFGGKFSIYIKNLVSLISFGLIYDQMYIAYKLKNDTTSIK